MKQLKYLGYCRKSSEEDSKQTQSIETQKRILRKFAVDQSIDLVDILIEKRSAKDDGNRPVFQQLLDRIQAGDANALFVAHIDRISRNEIESGIIVKLLSTGKLVEVRTPSRIYHHQDILYLNIEFAFASDYSRRLSARVLEGIESKLQKGEYPRSAPLGYLNRDGKIYPDPRFSTKIVELFELYSTGRYSLKQITQEMFTRGLRTKTGSRLVKSAIHRRLQDPIYYGAIRYNDRLFQGIHKPIISKSLFDRVQDVMAGKARPQQVKHDFMYRDYLLCAGCGCKITATLKKNRYIYYYCTNGKGICEQHQNYNKQVDIKNLLSSLFIDFSLPDDMATKSLEQYWHRFTKDHSTTDKIVQSLESGVQKIEKKLKKAEEAYFDEKIIEERFEYWQKKYGNQVAEIKTELKNLPKSLDLDSTLELLENFKHQAVNIGEMFYYGDDEVRSDLLKSALWNCSIKDKEIVTTRYKKPYQFFDGVSKSTDLDIWRGTRVWNPCVLITVPFQNRASRVILAKTRQMEHYKKGGLIHIASILSV